MRGKMILRQFVAIFLVALLCVLIPVKHADAVKPSIGLTMFMGVYIQCNDGDGYPFTELLTGKDIPASELYSRRKSSYAVEKCIYEKTKYAVTFPNSIDKRNYHYSSRAKNQRQGHPPLQVIANLNAMVKDGTIEMSPSVQKQLNGVFDKLDNDNAQIKDMVQDKIAESTGDNGVNMDTLREIDNEVINDDEPNDSVKPQEKKKYIYVPRK